MNPKDVDGDPIISHKSTMERLSKFNYICISVVNNDLLHIQNYCKEFMFPLKYHTQITEDGIQDITIWLAAGISE